MAQTLLSLAGASFSKPDLSNAVLVMIDCQQEYVDHALALPNVAAATAEAARVLDRVRSAGGAVIHVRHIGKADGAFDPGHPRGAFIEVCTPADGERIVDKTLPNAFAETDLADKLTALGRKPLILAGFMTHMCISATARAALDLGFGPAVIVGDACATRDLPDWRGQGVISADDLHNAELAALADRFAFVVKDAAAL